MRAYYVLQEPTTRLTPSLRWVRCWSTACLQTRCSAVCSVLLLRRFRRRRARCPAATLRPLTLPAALRLRNGGLSPRYRQAACAEIQPFCKRHWAPATGARNSICRSQRPLLDSLRIVTELILAIRRHHGAIIRIQHRLKQ